MEYLILENNYVVNIIKSDTEPTQYSDFKLSSNVSGSCPMNGYYDSGTNTVKDLLYFRYESNENPNQILIGTGSQEILFSAENHSSGSLKESIFTIRGGEISNFQEVKTNHRYSFSITPISSSGDIWPKKVELDIDFNSLKSYSQQRINKPFNTSITYDLVIPETTEE